MNERLKSFHKLFFIVLFTFLFSGIWGSGQVPDLEDRIAPELERIEALPRRTRPAELDIEVTKIKTEPLSEVSIDRESKNIYVDFSGKKAKTPKGTKTTEELEKQYNLVVIQNLEGSGWVNGKQRTKMKNGSQTMKHELTELEGKKVLKIPYETEPEKLYISVNENDNGKTVKVYSLDLKNALTIDPRGVIEEKTVIINLANGIKNYEGKTIVFNLDGSFYLSEIPTAEIQVIKQSGFHSGVDGFINSFSGAADITVTTPFETRTARKNDGQSAELQPDYRKDPHEVIVFQYLGDGKLGLRFQQINSTGLQTYTFDITHTSGNSIKKHKLIINSNIFINRKEATIKYLNGYDNVETTFDGVGGVNRTVIEVAKNNFTEGFINGFGASTPTYITVQQIDSSGNNIGATASAGRGANSTTGIEINMTDIKISFLNTGLLRLNMKTLDNTKSYRYKITHRNSNSPTGTVMMEHILNIQSRRKLMERTASLRDIVIEDVEGLNLETIYDFGTLGMEQIGNGSDLIDKKNPFPVLALGLQGTTVNQESGWSYSSNSTNTQSRDPITTAYKSTLATSITMQMYFANTTGIITNLEGGAVTILKKGNPETVVGAFGDAKREKMLTNLKGKITGDLNSLLTQFRASTAKEIIFESESKANEQISYVVAQKNEDENYYVPSKSDLNSSLVSDKKIEYRNYPKIMLRKPSIQMENLTLTIGNGFNLDSSITFTDSGINNVPNASLTSGSRYFKSLHFAGDLKINGVLYPIDATGNSVSIPDITLVNTNGDDLKLNIRYNGRYPKFKILNTPKRGEYVLNMSHHEPSGLELLQYTLTIKIDTDITPKEFKVTSNIRDILIFPQADGTATVEMPDNWVKVEQLVDDKGRFPVIGVNKPKWVISTDTPLNPIDMRPMAVLKLGTETISVPVNIRETPYQNPQKFFVYNRGEMTNKNLAVGAYTPISSTDGSGKNNRVQVGFQMFLEKEHLDKILAYGNSAEFNGKDRVEIPYATGEDHNIYAIRGIQQGSSEKFAVTEDNILDDGTIPFPKIFVIKNNIPSSNSATLTFSNPVPKSGVNLKGSFDIDSNGNKLPNDMPYTLDHPESLNVDGITPQWRGYAEINEYHKIDIKVLRDGGTIGPLKTITTNVDGTLKDNIQITNGSKYSYVLKKGKNSLVAIGLEAWDLSNTAQYEETLILEHKNSSGRVTHVDKYKVIIKPFNILTYLAQPNPAPADKKLTRTIETGTQRVPLIDFQLKNYDKEITKTTNDNIGVRIDVNTNPIELSNGIKGNLNFVGDKSSLINPNEIGSLVFTVTSGIIEANKTYSYNGIPLVTITTSKLTENIIERLEITGTPIDTSLTLPNFTAISNLKEIIINDSESIPVDPSMGRVSLKQETLPFQSDGTHAFPTIAVGNKTAVNNVLGWEVKDLINGEQFNDSTVRQKAYTKYSFENDPNNEIFTFRTFIGENYTMTGNTKAYKKVDGDNKTVIIGSHLSAILEKVESEIYLTLTKDILDKARQISGNRVVLRANPNDNNNKIALIHSKRVGNNNGSGDRFYLPTNNTNVPDKDRVGYFNYKNIIIEKDSFAKNLALNFLKTYANETEITLTNSSITTPEGVETTIYESGVLYGVKFKNKIKISSSDETVLHGITEYETDDLGNIATPIEIKMIKNGAEAILNLSYNNLDASLSLKDITGQETFNISLEHIEKSGDTRRKYNVALKTNSENVSQKVGEIDLVISSRYNALSGAGVLFKEGEIVYPKEVFDLKLISGDFPYKPESTTGIFIETHEGEFQLADTLRKTLTNGTEIDITKNINGELFIKPFYWRENNQSDTFNLIYKGTDNKVLEKYKFNVKTPNFFVVAMGELDFGKIYKMGNPPAITKTTDIELWYNDAGITAEYSIDLDSANPDSKTLYMDEVGKLRVTNLHLGDEKIDSGDGRRRILPLSGTIPGESIKDAPHGKYMKTLQILIHLK